MPSNTFLEVIDIRTACAGIKYCNLTDFASSRKDSETFGRDVPIFENELITRRNQEYPTILKPLQRNVSLISHQLSHKRKQRHLCDQPSSAGLRQVGKITELMVEPATTICFIFSDKMNYDTTV